MNVEKLFDRMSNEHWFRSMHIFERYLKGEMASISPEYDEVFVRIPHESFSADDWEQLKSMGWFPQDGGICVRVIR